MLVAAALAACGAVGMASGQEAPARKGASPTSTEAAPAVEKPVPAPKPLGRGEAAQLEKLVAAAKGYRPLYNLLEAELRKAFPDVAIVPRSGFLSIGAPVEFAALTLHATELRLGLALGDHHFDTALQKARLKGAGTNITHMLVLTDARQVNADLIVSCTHGRTGCAAAPRAASSTTVAPSSPWRRCGPSSGGRPSRSRW